MRIQKHLHRLLILITIVLFQYSGLRAQSHVPVSEFMQHITGTALTTGAYVTVENERYFNPAYSVNIDTPYPVKNTVTLKLDESSTTYLASPFTATVRLRIVYTTAALLQDSVERDFVIGYDTAAYKSQDIFAFNGAHRVIVRVLSTSVNSANSAVTFDKIASSLVVEDKMLVQPAYKFVCTNVVTSLIYTDSAKINPDELYVSWNEVTGAHEYDLEWSYIDSSALSSHVYGNPLNTDLVFENNASRVSITGSMYAIPMMYNDAGTLFVRVRPVQYKNEQRFEANWSSGNALGQYVFKGHERDLNWQSTVSYAEEGKRKVVVQYYDGSLRSRQTVTKDNTTNTTIVAENFYDYQGRPVIQVMPVPTLNSIIGYTRNFNVGLNGAEYEKNNFDTLTSAGEYCNTGAAAFGTQSGAAQYYSASSPDKTGLNSYIPDAQGYPFTETQYTQDATGRISKQSGVGSNYKLGSNHETRYYYGSPSQEELDALFGTEVGDHNHYFKNAVQDANGQFSVSYVDMHGRTIATALAGATVAGMDALSSNSVTDVTENLLDTSGTIFRGTIIENKKSLLVETAGTNTFTYKLSPEALTKEACAANTSICYSCLYDLRITVTDDCNNQKLPGGKAFDTVIHNFKIGEIGTDCIPDGFEVEFALDLVPGTYDITKQLSISKYGTDYYRDSVFMPANTCVTLADMIEEQRSIVMNNRQCKPDCATCRADLGTWDDYRIKFMQQAGIANADTAANRGLALAAYNEALDACNALCDSSTDADNIRTAMLADVTPPSGQYADISNMGSKYSIFYVASTAASENPSPARFQSSSLVFLNDAGNPDSVYNNTGGSKITPNQLSAQDFSDQFQTSWAEALLPLHPEYCKLTVYESYSASNKWDRDFEATDTYKEAYDAGYLNPTADGNVQYKSVSDKKDPLSINNSTALRNKLTTYMSGVKLYKNGQQTTLNLNMWSVATLTFKVSLTDTTGAYKYIDNPFDTTAMCEGDLDMAWRNFRTFYLQAKKDVLNTLITQQCPASTDAPSSALLQDSGFASHFSNGSEMMTTAGFSYALGTNLSAQTLNDSANAILQRQYDANCQAYAKYWTQQLAPCKYDSNDVNNILIPRLVAVCKEGADINHTMGASTVKPSSTYAYRSFNEVLSAYNIEKGIDTGLVCNAELITTPEPYDRQVSSSVVPIYTRPDSCQCATIQTLYAEYVRDTLKYNSFSAYLQATRQTTMSETDLQTLLSMCKSTGNASSCTFLAKPVNLPPALQCGMQHLCVTCTEVDSLYSLFSSAYPGLTPTAADTTDQQHQINQLFAAYMNNRLGFAKETWEYLDFINTCSQRQTSTDTVCASSPFYHRYYTNQGSAYLNSIVKTRDNGYVMAGAITVNNIQHGYVVKTNSGGAMEWSKVYGVSQNIAFASVCVGTDSGYVVTGQIATDTKRALIMKLGETGAVTWSRTTPYTTVGGEVGRFIMPLSNGNYGFAGGYDYRGGYADQLVGVITSAGAISWLKRVGSNDSDDGGSLAEVGDTLLLTGETYNQGGTLANGEYDGVIYKLNKNDGTLYGFTDYSFSGQHNYFGHIEKVTNGYRVASIATNNWDIQQGSQNVVGIITVNPGGDVIASKGFGEVANGQIVVSHAETAAPVDDYLVVLSGKSSPSDICVVKVNASGSVSRSSLVNLPGDQFPNTIAAGWNNKYVVAGSGDGAGMQMSLDSVGRSGCYDSLFLVDEREITVEKGTYRIPYVNSSLATPLTAIVISDTAVSYVNDSIGCYSNCAYIYGGPMLCGSTTPVFDTTGLVSEVDNCTDTSFFIQSKAMELYQVYTDSLKGSFDNDYVQKCLNAYKLESFTVKRSVSEYHYTLYYYDQAGNLAKTVPPAGVHPNRDATWLSNVKQVRQDGGMLVPAHEMVTWYAYNTLNQVAQQQTPDASTSNFWYDRLGRLAISQNRKQSLVNQYSYTLYDYLGRITEVGQLTSSSPMTAEKSRNAASLQGWLDTANSSKEQITVTVYDEPYTASDKVLNAVNLRNRVAYTLLYSNQADREATGNQFATATFYSYDIHGNVDTLLQDYKAGAMADAGNRFKRMVYQYDLISGKVNQVAYQPGQPDAFYHQYIYDAENRIISVETSHDSVNWESDAAYQYYKHGPLQRSVIGQQQVQGLDYIYTLQGWIKAVNPASSFSTGGANGTGGNCAAGSAVDDLEVNARPLNGPPTYTARETISFEDGFDTNGEETESVIDASLASCVSTTADYSSDGKTASAAAVDAFGYVLQYNATDYAPINAITPDVQVAGQLGADYRPLYNGNISGMGVVNGKLNGPIWYNYKYDQLNRLAQTDAWKAANASWSGLVKSADYHEAVSYDANGNILNYLRNGTETGAPKLDMDKLTYHYETGKNRLTYIEDTVDAANYTVDIDNQAADNYAYDSIGNLTQDLQGNVGTIEWNVYGKIKKITKQDGSEILYTYDVAGNRISKTSGGVVTWYVRDAQGNVMSTYAIGDASVNSGHATQKEVDLYGSSRIGVLNTDIDMTIDPIPVEMPKLDVGADVYAFTRGKKLFELGNHLGNVLATVSDRRIPVSSNGSTVDYYTADVASAQDYYPFGMLQPGRSYNVEGYRYGFNGKENDNDVKGDGNQQDYGMRIYDPRIGKFLSVDPLTDKFPELSPFQFASNSPLENSDLDGLESLSEIKAGLARQYQMSIDMANINVIHQQQDHAQLVAMAQHPPVPSIIKQAPQRGHYDQAQHDEQRKNIRAQDGYPENGQPFWANLSQNKHWQGLTNNVVTPLVEQAIGEGMGGLAADGYVMFKSSGFSRGMARLGEANEEGSMIYNGVMSGHLPSDYGNGLNLGRTRLTDAQMHAMTELHGVEFAQTYTAGSGKNGGGGFYNLYSGTRSAVDVPIGPDIYLINHTHPGGTAAPSIFDIRYLEKAASKGSLQKSSIILPAGKQPVRFNVNTVANGAE